MSVKESTEKAESEKAAVENTSSEKNTSGSSGKADSYRITDIILRVLRIAVFAVIMVWLVVPHEVNQFKSRKWIAPTYVVVSYNMPAVDCEKVGFYLFPFNFMDTDDLWDKFEAEKQGITMSEAGAKEYEMVTTRSSHWPWN